MNNGILHNLYLLRKDMRNKGWLVTAFSFRYKSKTYFIIATDIKSLKKNLANPEYQYITLLLKFIDANDFSHFLEVKANTKSNEVENIKLFRYFFNIDYSSNFGNIIEQFSEYLANFVPKTVPHLTPQAIDVLCHDLDNMDNTNHGKYCIGIKRNPYVNNYQYQRTLFNEQKTKLLRPSLFEIFKEDKTISFCYSNNKQLEKSDTEILHSFSTRLSIR